MKQITRLYGVLFTAVLAVLTMALASFHTNAQTPYGKLIYQDDFSSSNAVWRFKLLTTHDNPTAIAASYGKIEGGVLMLKANVGCGWDYLNSVASLQLPLSEDYIIEYRFRKTEWCGPFAAGICGTNELDDSSLWVVPWYTFSVAGSWFEHLTGNSSTNYFDIPPASVPFNYDGTWYNVRIVKRGTHVVVYVNNNQQWNYSGQLVSGGFLHFVAMGAGSTADVDDLKIYEIGQHLSIETAAVRLRWLAESNVTYQVQWSTDMQTWSNLTSVLGTGSETNLVDCTDGPRRFYRLILP